VLLHVGFAQQPGFVDELTHPSTLAELQVDVSVVHSQPMCAGGIYAWRRGSAAYQRIIPRAIECALREECIVPMGAGEDNHRNDQVISP
jgi:hypothetical protein